MIDQLQQKAVEKFKRVKRMALFTDLGTGKTKIAIDCIKAVKAQTLVVAPLKVALDTWPDEFEKWGVSDFQIFYKCIIRNAPVVVTNYESLSKIPMYFDFLIFDESTYLKNYKTKRFKIANKLASKAKYVLIMSATPTPREIDDIWSQIYLLDRGERLSTLWNFRRKYMHEIKMNRFSIYKSRKGAFEEVMRKIKDITVSFDKQIDPLLRFEEVVFKPLKSMHYSHIMDARKHSAGLLTDNKAKVEWILRNVDRAVVAINFREEAKMLDRLLPDSAYIIGGMHTKKVKKVINSWKDRSLRYLILHPGAAGYGLNLQSGGNKLVWHSLPVDLEHYLQTNGRLYRLGQKEDVSVFHLIHKNSIDAHISDILKRKNLNQQLFLKKIKDYFKKEIMS